MGDINFMILIFVRTIIIYILVLFVMRFMGKREIGQMQPFELVIAMMIADLAATPMSDVGIPILYGIIPILSLLMMHIIISVINLKSIKMREIICGKPRILIYRGKIDEDALIKENFTINELQERLRGNNINNLGDVEFAILETSGQISVVQKPEKRTLRPDDFNIKAEYEGISYHDLRITDGEHNINVIFDLVVPHQYENDKLKELVSTIKSKVKEQNNKYTLVIKVDRPYVD